MNDVLGYFYSNMETHYYKNKLLHREDGPAVCKQEDRIKYPDNFTNRIATKNYQCPTEKAIEKINGIIKQVAGPKTIYANSSFYLEGVNYSEKEYYSVLLKEKLQSDLSKKDETKRKNKI